MSDMNPQVKIELDVIDGNATAPLESKPFIAPSKYELISFYVLIAIIAINSLTDTIIYAQNAAIVTLCALIVFFQMWAMFFLTTMICGCMRGARMISLVLCWVSILLSPIVLALIPLPVVAGIGDEMLMFCISTYTYITATASGLISGVRKTFKPDALYITEIGLYITSSFLFVQIWSFVDRFTVIYVIAWNIVHFTKIYAIHTRREWLRHVCNVMYTVVAVAVVIGFSQVPSEIAGIIIHIVLSYIVLTLGAIIRAAIIRYLVSGLTELLLINLRYVY